MKFPTPQCSSIKADPDAPSVKKMKNEVDENDKIIEKQNKEYHKMRDTLKAGTQKSLWLSILSANKQSIPEGNAEVSWIIIIVSIGTRINPLTLCHSFYK